MILITAGILLTASLFIGCGSGGWNVAGVADDRVSFEVTGLESGKTYYWRVLAVDEENETSEPGETRSFTVH
ncbi:hypothetical protein ASZ90_008529 [hydrocarbon metagenome]|uniref:Fibronectin type-III domain-containing protein n=1 Tax=hydrocarbon metagenome TaxID=938273 RepID=A0A0W8FL82_9ZZZZ